MKLSGVAALAVCVCLIVVVTTAPAPARAASTRHPRVTVAQQLVLPHRLAPQLGQDARGDQTLVTGVPDGRGALSQLLVRERPTGGAWGADQALTPVTRGLSAPTLAVGTGGVAVLAWYRSLGGAAFVRVRDTSGTWGEVTRLPGVAPYSGLQVRVTGDGSTAAVAATQESGSTRIGVYAGGRWSMVDNPGDGTPSIALDDAGTLYAATDSVQRGGAGEVTLARRPASGHWSRPVRVGGLGPMPQEVTVQATPSGRLTLLVGYADRKWRSTYDSELYYATGHLVLSAPRWGRPWRQLWKRSGAVAVDATVTGRGTVRLVYQQWLDRVGRRPTAIALRAVGLRAGGAHGRASALTLDDQPATLSSGGYDTATTGDGSGTLRVWWRPLPVRASQSDTQSAGDLHAAAVTFAGSGSTGSDADLPGTALPDSFLFGGLAETSAAGPDAAWVQDLASRASDAYGHVVLDGTVVVGRAG